MASMITLRDYQERCIDEIRGAYKTGSRAPLLCSPTGSGKSATLGYMLGNTKKRTLILAHRTELVQMISQSLPVQHGIIMPGHRQTDDLIQVGMMQTVNRRLDRLPKFEWVISDEAHLAICPTWLGILKYYGDAWHLGMSATPCRLDGRGLGEHYDKIIYGPSIGELIDRKYLVPWIGYGPPTAVGALRKSGSDINLAEAAKEFGKAVILGDAVAHMKRRAPDRLNLVFCCDVEHAKRTAEEYCASGVPAEHIHGGMDSETRRQVDARFRSGQTRVLCNVDLYTTGYDFPAISALTFLRRTTSLALFLQMIGRGLRISPGKENCIVFDHAGNMAIHGFPDEDREWSLDGAAKKKKESDAEAVSQCLQCYFIHKPAPVCPNCGHVKPVKARSIETQDGELMEITRDTRANLPPLKEEMRGVRSIEQLIEIAQKRGYARGWIYHHAKLRNIPMGRS